MTNILTTLKDHWVLLVLLLVVFYVIYHYILKK